MAILQLARELMEDVQGQRSAEIMEQAVLAPTAEPRGQTGDAPPPPAAAQPKRQPQPSQADLLDGRRGKRARCNQQPCW